MFYALKSSNANRISARSPILFQSQTDGVSTWLNEIEVFLVSEEAAIGDLDTLQAQLTESQVRDIMLLLNLL